MKQNNKFYLTGLLVLITGIVYFNSLKAPFLLDDFKKIAENPDIRRLENIPSKLIYPYGPKKIFERNDPSRPLIYLTFTLNYFIGRLNPFTYHLFNLIIHILNVILVFFLARKIILYLLKADIPLSGFFVALFFAVHPVNVPSVTYIFSRSDLLATLFYLVSVLSFIKTFENGRRYYLLSVLSFLLALASKQSAVTLPAVILLVDYMLLSDFDKEKVFRKKYYHMALWALLVAYLASRYFYFGAIGDVEATVPWIRKNYLAIQPYMFMRYFQLLLVPAGLCIDHAIAHLKVFDIKILLSLAAIACAAVVLLRFYMKKSQGARLLVFCALWFFVILSPTSSFFPTTSALVENRMYLSGIGFYIALMYAYFLIFKKNFLSSAKADKISQLMVIALSVHIVILSAVTVKRNFLFRNPLELWNHAISMYPWNASAHNRLANIYRKQGEPDRAINEFLISIKLNPDFAVETYNNIAVIYLDRRDYSAAFNALSNVFALDPKYAPAYNNLGVLYQKQDKLDRAMQYFKKALEIDPGYLESRINIINILIMQGKNTQSLQEINDTLKSNPGFAQARSSLGIYYLNTKDYARASEELKKALNLNPENAIAHDNLGIIYIENRQFDKAAVEFKRAIEIDPGLADAHINLGNVYTQKKLFKQAFDQLQKAFELAPDNYKTHYNFGVLYYNMNDFEKALYAFEKTIEINPRFANAYNNLGILFLKTGGSYDEATKAFRKAIELEPANINALYNLAYIYSSQNKYSEALRIYERLLKLNPADEQAKNKMKLIRAKAQGS